MKTLWLAALPLLASPVAASAGSLPADLAKAAAEYDQAQMHSDGAALERLLAPEYHLVNGGAKVETRDQFIKESTAADFKLDPFKVENPIETVWSDGAVLAGEVRVSGSDGGQPFAAHMRFADIWAKRDGRWQVVFTEVTRFPS